MTSPPSSCFNCDCCALLIAAQDPRGRCTVCPDYDLCAKCFLGERCTKGHNFNHPVQVFKQSGGGGYPPLLASNGAPTSAPSSAIPPPQSGWGPFFRDDMSPTPIFLALMNDIFAYLDPANNGNLEPEVFSQLQDDMGLPAQENGWKSALRESGTMSKESNADSSLKNIFDMFSIEHVLLLRTRPVIQSIGGGGNAGGLARAFRNAVVPQVSHQGPMPAITRRGFIELFTINQLSEPSTEWAALSRVLRKYQLPKYAAWGDMPRSVLPEVPHPGMVLRVQNIKNYAVQKSLQAVEAARANAMIRARGQQAALDIIGNTRTEYVYR